MRLGERERERMSHSVFPGLIVLSVALNEPRHRRDGPRAFRQPDNNLGMGSLGAGRRERQLRIRDQNL